MPEHWNFITLLLLHSRETLNQNATSLGQTFVGHHPADWHSFEPITTSVVLMLVLIAMAAYVRSQLADVGTAVVPDESLTLRTFAEVFLDYFYNLAKDVMDADRAKKYFPLIATSACFVFFANVLALFPGLPVATTSLSITLGSAFVVFVLFNYWGFKENGFGYLKHLAGPVWYLAPLVFPIELISLCVRPLTLGLRLMLNMAVDHLLVAIFMGFLTIVVPIPVMILTCLVVLIQTLVFTLLTCIYIGLATEHEEHH
ncbi:MAG TPA: F0F1 ATP synthase subunit A [Polyangiaceae bacterium]|jgi:F-type H+-transporting ATPase subunit a|nr:F0F1 ATP synthase subunit A [Polyangiaceae bacterium]